MKIVTIENDKLVKSNAPVNKELLNASREKALERLELFDVKAYARSRNSLDGEVSKLSVYIEHGLLDREDFLHHINATQSLEYAEPILKQLYWREFFLQTYEENRSKIWQDYEPYKTGYVADEYSNTLADDIKEARTGIALIDILIEELEITGYLHNHGRLYLASYIVHFRKIKWQVGASWMLCRLHDANLAVNNLSWQWVASTRSNKPYIFNWENIEKFAAKKYGLKREDHKLFDATYEVLSDRLFKKVPQDV